MARLSMQLRNRFLLGAFLVVTLNTYGPVRLPKSSSKVERGSLPREALEMNLATVTKHGNGERFRISRPRQSTSIVMADARRFTAEGIA